MGKNANHDDHAPNVGLYVKVFGALMVLTFVTVIISKFHLPRPQAIALGLLVATVKASLVAAVFMHLWGENKLIHKTLMITGACAFILIIPLIDCSVLVHKITGRMPVAEQHPAEEGHEAAGHVETVTEKVVLTPAPAPAAKKAPAKKKGK